MRAKTCGFNRAGPLLYPLSYGGLWVNQAISLTW
jgi:hypothetical protein